MSRHATPRGHLALIAIDRGDAQQLDPDVRCALADIGWANAIHGHWRLTATGRAALADANHTAAANRIRSAP